MAPSSMTDAGACPSVFVYFLFSVLRPTGREACQAALPPLAFPTNCLPPTCLKPLPGPSLIYNSACFACMLCGGGGAGLLAVTLWPMVVRCNRNRNRNRNPAGGPVKRRPDLVLVSHLLACSLSSQSYYGLWLFGVIVIVIVSCSCHSPTGHSITCSPAPTTSALRLCPSLPVTNSCSGSWPRVASSFSRLKCPPPGHRRTTTRQHSASEPISR